MEKSIFSDQHRVLCSILRELRRDAGLRQVDVATELGVNQTFVSKYEKGERRLDLVELRAVVHALGKDLPGVVQMFEDQVVTDAP